MPNSQLLNNKARSRTARLGLVALTLAFVISQFLRTYLAVISPTLTADLQLTDAEFGWISASYFFSFSLSQIPLGLLFDRVGIRWPVGMLIIFGAGSAFGMSIAPGFTIALMAQAGLGLACAPVFMGLIYYTYERFEAAEGAWLIAMASAIGSAGSLFTATPLGWLSSLIGWRASLIGVSVLMLGTGTLVLLCTGGPMGDNREDQRTFIQSLRSLLSDPRYLALIPVSLVMSIGGSLRASWSGPYLDRVYQLGVFERGNALAVISLFGVASAFAIPVLMNRFAAKTITYVWLAGGLCSAGILFLWPAIGASPAVVLLALWFAVGNIHPLVMAQARQVVQRGMRGVGLGLLNSCVFFGMAIASGGFGIIAQSGTSKGLLPSSIFGQIFLAGGIPIVLATVCYHWSHMGKDDHPSSKPRTP
jgi:predicted MFS family arabinose efflux permease